MEIDIFGRTIARSMRKNRVISIFFLLAILAHSCKDTGDHYPPVIHIIYPSTGVYLEVPDTLEVRAEVTDDRVIRSISVSLLNSNKIPVAPVKYYYPEIYHYNLHALLEVTDKTLESGQYTLQVTAFDGFNESRRSVKVNLNEVEKEVTGYIMVTSSFLPQSTISSLNRQFESDTAFVLSKPFGISGVHGAWDLFCFVSDNPSVLYAYSSDKFEIQWEFAALPPKPVFSSLWTDKQILFGTMNGDAGILNRSGKVTLITPTQPGKSVDCLAADDQYIYAELVSWDGMKTELTLFYRLSGLVRAQYLVQQDITGILPSDGKALIFGNKHEDGLISELDPESMKLTEIARLEGVRINSAVMITGKLFLLLSAQRVYLFDYTSSGLMAYIEGNYDLIRFDPLDEWLFLVRDRELKVVEWSLLQPVYQQVFNERILDFQILYNK